MWPISPDSARPRLGLYLLVLPRIDPVRANQVLFSTAYGVIRVAGIACIAVIDVVTILAIYDVRVDVGRLISLGLRLLFVVLGSVLGKVRPNGFVGIRTPWTLCGKRSWVKRHRLGGYLFVPTGLAILVAALASDVAAFAATMATLIALTVVLVIDCYVVWRHDPDKPPPSGSLPGPIGRNWRRAGLNSGRPSVRSRGSWDQWTIATTTPVPRWPGSGA